MHIRESSYGYWSSARAFLWVATGAVLGIGNVLRLPYLMGEYGGLVFLGAYIVAMAILGVPLLLAEWMLGRWMRADLVHGYAEVAETARARRIWRLLGWFTLAGAVMLLSYYSVIAGWSMAYTFRAAADSLGGTAELARAGFLALAQDPERGLAWHTLFIVIACMIVSHGFRDGIERAAGYLVPAAFLLMGIVAMLGVRFGDAPVAVTYLFTPDLSRFGWRGALEAFQQAFFTLALGFGAMTTLAAYLPASVPLLRLSIAVAAFDTLFSLVLGVGVFALLMGAAVVPQPGLGLLFESLPQALPAGAAGIAIATPFYLMLFLVTMTSAIALLEPLTRYLMERFRYTRVFAAATGAVAVWYLGLGSLLSFSALSETRVLGWNFFEWMQVLTANVLAPISGLLVCTFAARIMPRELLRGAWGPREKKAFWPWWLALCYGARLSLVAILLYAFGVLEWLAQLWS